MTTATVETIHGERERVSLPEPHFLGEYSRREHLTGTTIQALYAGPRTGRKFARIYSIWDNGNHGIVGRVHQELTESEYLHYCELVGCEPVHVEPVAA